MNEFEKSLRTELALTFMTRIPFAIGKLFIRVFSKPRFLMSEKERRAYEKRLWRLS